MHVPSYEMLRKVSTHFHIGSLQTSSVVQILTELGQDLKS